MNECDVVMKGGITSGIVYPGAVYELSREFSFVNIGGTSAGAIAAALTAAAEYRRKKGGDDGGFAELRTLPEWLSKDNNLLKLFQPSDSLRPIYTAAVRYMETKNAMSAVGVIAGAFTTYAVPVGLLGAFGAIVSIVAAWMLRHEPIAFLLAILAIVSVLLAAAGCLVACVIEAVMFAKDELPKNNFGICSGDVLAKWLDERIRSVSGADHPLTFGDLEAQGVNLEMMTTNLTQGRPYRLPMQNRMFFFSPEQMRKLFPKDVVEWMLAHGQTDDGEFYSLPEKKDLPIVVATRMSLSFPVLLSAVPLWAKDFGSRVAAGAEHGFECCWFSDGGISSNFPVHFFDAPLPSRPTFAFILVGRTPRYHKSRQQIFTAKSNRGGITEWWSPIETIPQFLGSIMTTMQNWRDNMLLRVPGQRDRIAHVLLTESEGGLNLTMDERTIRHVAKRGRLAAITLRRRFGANPPAETELTWRNHRWVRLRAYMYAMQESLGKLARVYDPTWEELFDNPRSYAEGSRKRMSVTLLNLVLHARQDYVGPLFELKDSPKPPSELRAMPRE